MVVGPIQSEMNSIDYDYENDSLFFFVKGAQYNHSLNLDNVILDFGEGNTIKGVEIQNASKKFGVPKHAIRNPAHMELEFNISKERIELKISLTLKIRNQAVPKAITAADLNTLHMPAGRIAMSCGVC